MVMTRTLAAVSLLLFLGVASCAPEVGSEKWCEQMKEKPKGDWTANEAKDFLKHCIFESSEDDDE